MPFLIIMLILLLIFTAYAKTPKGRGKIGETRVKWIIGKTNEGKKYVINDLIVDKTATIGEKLSLRRFEILTKEDSQVFGEYSHMGGKIVALTLVSNNEEVAKDLAMQAAAMRPLYVNIAGVPEADLEHEKSVIKEQVINEGKKLEFADKIVEGRINKFYEETVLEEQAFIKDGGVKVREYLANNNSSLLDLIRYEVGEGMEKRNDDFAAEVMSQIK